MDAQVEIVQTKITQGNNSLHVTAQAGANVTINQSRTDDSPLDLLLKVGTPLAALAATFFIHRSTQQRIDESKEELQAEIHHRLASKTPILGLIPGKDDSYSSVWLDMANGSFIHGEKQEPHEGDPGYPVTFSLRDIIPGTRCWVSPDVLVVPCDEIRIEGKDKNGEGTFFTFLKSSLTLEAFRLAEPPHWALLPDKERENGICLYLSNGAIIDGIVLEPSSDDPAPPVFFELHNIPEDLLCYAPPEVKIANRDPNYEGMTSDVVRAGDKFMKQGGEINHAYSTNRGQIIGAYALVYRTDRKVPAYFFAPFDEYCKKDNATWRQYPSAMIIKVAESMALKRAFSISGLVTEEEIGRDDKVQTESATATGSGNISKSADEPSHDRSAEE